MQPPINMTSIVDVTKIIVHLMDSSLMECEHGGVGSCKEILGRETLMWQTWK